MFKPFKISQILTSITPHIFNYFYLHMNEIFIFKYQLLNLDIPIHFMSYPIGKKLLKLKNKQFLLVILKPFKTVKVIGLEIIPTSLISFFFFKF